jgi:hypothetical protein
VSVMAMLMKMEIIAVSTSDREVGVRGWVEGGRRNSIGSDGMTMLRASIRARHGKRGGSFPTTTSITAPSIINDQAIITTKAIFTWKTSL